MPTNLLTGGTASGNSFGGKTPDRAFDGSLATAWTNANTSEPIFYDVGSAITVSSWSAAFNADGVNPLYNTGTMAIYGSNDAVNYTLLDTYTAAGDTNSFANHDFSSPNSTAYRYYKFVESNVGFNVGIVEIEAYAPTGGGATTKNLTLLGVG